MLTAQQPSQKALPPLPFLTPVPREHKPKATIPPLFGFDFKKRYEGLYTNRHERFVLREEHIAELKRIVNEHRRDNMGRGAGISMSDIVNAALDFALEHQTAFRWNTTGELRESLAREVYCKAFFHFTQNGWL